MSKCKIKVLSNGPYLVSGTVSLKEKIIVEKPHIAAYQRMERAKRVSHREKRSVMPMRKVKKRTFL